MQEHAGNDRRDFAAMAQQSPRQQSSPAREQELVIPISDRSDQPPWSLERLRRAVIAICGDAGFRSGEISIAIVGSREMQDVHRRFLGDDSPTDVIAFPLNASSTYLEGEIVVCWEVSRESASQFQWRAEDELLLYVVHGALHLVGYNDTSDQAFQSMRSAEEKYLGTFNLTLIGRDQSAHPGEY